MPSESLSQPICGIYSDPFQSRIHLSIATENNQRKEITLPMEYFLWLKMNPDESLDSTEKLSGPGFFNGLASFQKLADFKDFVKSTQGQYLQYQIKPLENLWLLQNQKRLFENLPFQQLKRCQIDIETGCSVKNGFSHAHRQGDRVLAIGLRLFGENTYLVLENDSDDAERELLQSFCETLKTLDPDVIEGHNFFRFDLDYLRIRSDMLGVKLNWGRFGKPAKYRNSRIRIAERWIEFPRYDIPGRAVFDTYIMIQLYDLTKRELPSYGLKKVATYLGITKEDHDRTYLLGHEIQESFNTDRDRFLAYLGDDLRETQGVADLLLPTYFAQAQNFPMTLQEITLRGTAQKVEILFLEKYYHARHALPQPKDALPFEGGYTKSFETGVFKNILHFDVASLYPSILLYLNKNPINDPLGVFIPLLKELRAYRLEYKKKAAQTSDPLLKHEFEARQQSFKILINSFYGYLGFSMALFGDSSLAAEVTAMGRDLLVSLVNRFEELGCQPLEADTDGIYVCANHFFENPAELLEKVRTVMPEGIDLEFDGAYPSMYCYKAKNYALYDGEKLIIRGSALRSRGMEPFLKELTDGLIKALLGISNENPKALVKAAEAAISSGTMPVEKLAKSENLSQNPDSYLKAINLSKKPRRASLEVALTLDPPPKMGEKVTYFIKEGEKARMPDWQRAVALQHYHAENCIPDPKYYLKKLKDWEKRYADFISGE